MKLGILGTGKIVREFLPWLAEHTPFTVQAICSTERSAELAQSLCGQYGVPQHTTNFLELLQWVDVVYIAVPNLQHVRYARVALEAGKHVIVEKPFTTTVEEGEELVALAAEKGLTLSVYQNRRWDCDFLTVKEILDKGLLGRLVEFESTFPRYRNFIKPNTWKETGESGGGLTYNLGAHVIDQAVQLFGMPEAVFADIATLRTGGKVDDYFIIHLLKPAHAPEVKITLKASYLMCENEPRFVLHGTEGSYVKYGLDPQEADLTKGILPDTLHWGEEDKSQWGILHTEKNGDVVRESYPTLPGNYAAFYENIYQHVRKGEVLQSDACGVLGVIRLIEAAWESSRTGSVIRL